MIHLASQTWNKSNRSEKLESILTALNRTGTTKIKYFNWKTNIISYYLWRGDPQPVNENDEWNYAKIFYQGKIALDFLELRAHLLKSDPEFGGHFFDENFTESKKQHVMNILNDAGIVTYRASLTKGRKLLMLFSIILSFFVSFLFFKSGAYYNSAIYYVISVLYSCIALLFVAYLIWILKSSSTMYRKENH